MCVIPVLQWCVFRQIFFLVSCMWTRMFVRKKCFLHVKNRIRTPKYMKILTFSYFSKLDRTSWNLPRSFRKSAWFGHLPSAIGKTISSIGIRTFTVTYMTYIPWAFYVYVTFEFSKANQVIDCLNLLHLNCFVNFKKRLIILIKIV